MDTSVEKRRELEKNYAMSVAEELESEEQPTNCVVDGAYAFILRISSFCGLAPLKFESRRNGYTVKISDFMCAYSYVLITVLMMFVILGLLSEINSNENLRNANDTESENVSSQLSKAVITCDVLVVAVVAATGIYSAPRRMRDLFRFMKLVALVDVNLGARYSVLKKPKVYAVLLAVMVSVAGLLGADLFQGIVLTQSFTRINWDMLMNRFGYHLLMYVTVILDLQLALTMLTVRPQFQAVNEELKLTTRNINVPVKGEAQQIMATEAIQRLIWLHSILGDVVDIINKGNGLLLMVNLMAIFVHLIVKPYFLVMQILASKNRINILVAEFLWCTTYFFRMFGMVEASHHTVTEAERTKKVMCRLMTSLPSPRISSYRLELLTQQLMLQTVSYSPMGMCTVDRPLMASVLGAVTTYIIILIQFQS